MEEGREAGERKGERRRQKGGEGKGSQCRLQGAYWVRPWPKLGCLSNLSPPASSFVKRREVSWGIQGKIHGNFLEQTLANSKRVSYERDLTFSSSGMTRMPPTLRRLFMYSSCSFCTPAPQYTRSYWEQSGEISRQLPVTKEGSQKSNLKAKNVFCNWIYHSVASLYRDYTNHRLCFPWTTL